MTNENVQNRKGKKLWGYFTTYEVCWFLIFTALTIAVSIVFPEESINGVSGTLLTVIYLFNVILGIFCELLTSKQSKWSLFLYIFVEIIEIVKFILISALFASMIVSLFFWLPMHIISFISWHKHEDQKRKELTVVRSLKPKHAVILFVGVAVWTLVMGYLVAAYAPDTEFFSNDSIKVTVSYLDACISALAIANGILLYFRFKENWIVWLISSILCIITYALTGWWVFIVLQLGYITNTIYGYACWTKYIKNKANEQANDQTDGEKAVAINTESTINSESAISPETINEEKQLTVNNN